MHYRTLIHAPVRALLPFAACLPTLAAQVLPAGAQAGSAPADVKPARGADPFKGYGEVTAMAAGERRSARRPHADGVVAQNVLAGRSTGLRPTDVHCSTGIDGRIWASGATYKASFGGDGFTYIPFLGRTAPKNYPVRFTIGSVRVGGVDLAFARDVLPSRTGDRIVFDRGSVREIYDLGAQGVEQSFVVAGAGAGDLCVALVVDSELCEDAERAGVQFTNAFGGVHYGDAFVVDGAGKQALVSTFAGNTLTLTVPAHMRPAGDVVIDPVISTSNVSFALQDFDQPDIAFDVDTGHYLVVWQREFSATDCDVWCEMRDANGTFVAGSAQAIDNTTAYLSKPRVANLNPYDSFLVVAERFVSSNPVGQQYDVWGQTVDAASPFALGGLRQYSGPEPGDKRDPDVGGDGLTVYVQPTLPVWTVAYTREISSTDHDIHARQVNGSGTPSGGTIFVENSGATIHRDVEISQTAGRSQAADRRWVLVYSYKFSATDWDVYGAAIAMDGTVTQPSTAIDASALSHRNPSVSSPTAQAGGPAMYGVTFEDASNIDDLRGAVVTATLQRVVPTTNLSLLLQVGSTYHARIETDGCRFAVAFATALPAHVATLGVVNGAFVVHEPPQHLRAGVNAYNLNVTSRGITGGANTGYGIVFTDAAPDPDRIVFATYEGHGAGGLSTRATGCNGLGITASGQPLLGRVLNIALTGTNGHASGMLLGSPGPALALCASCGIGINLNGAWVNLPNRAQLDLTIPCLHQLVGKTLTLQGYAIGGGPCPGGLRLGDSLDFVVQ